MIVCNLSVADLIGNTLDSRDEAQRLAERIREYIEIDIKEIILDFEKVVFMSRSFADEFFKAEQTFKEKYAITLIFENADEQILEIMQAVSLTQDNPIKTKTNYVHLKFTDMEKLSQHILSY